MLPTNNMDINLNVSPIPPNPTPPPLSAVCHHVTADEDNSQGKDSRQSHSRDPFSAEQRQGASLREMIDYLELGVLPGDDVRARRILLQSSQFTVIDGVLYFIDPKQRSHKKAAVPEQLRQQILRETHSSPYAGHFSGQRLYNALNTRWWWEGMFTDARRYASACPECAVVSGNGRVSKPPLHPIPVSRPFQILGIDIMDLPLTDQGNKHVVLIQVLFTKWSMAFAVPDQKTTRIARLIAEEVIPMFGVPECLLSDRGTNPLSNLMMNLCQILGITKLNTTAYHPQCDGAVERFILRKHAAKFGCQWDCFLPGVLWAYRNTPHTSTGEKPSFLLYGIDCRSPTAAAYLPLEDVNSTDPEDYREELMISLTSAHQLAASCIQKAQRRYKNQYDRRTKEKPLRIGAWVLIHFPQDESGRWRKLSRPWHGPYRITEKTDPDVTCIKVYHPQDGSIRIHQSRVCPCPEEFPAGYYWYGGKRKGPGRPPKWVDCLLQSGAAGVTHPDTTDHSSTEDGEANDRDPPVDGVEQLMEEQSNPDPDPPIDDVEQLMGEHLQPQQSPSPDQSCSNLDQNIDKCPEQTTRDGSPNTEGSCDGPEPVNEAHCGTNANNSPAEVDRNAKSDDVDEGYCYSPEQGLQTIDGQLQGSTHLFTLTLTLHMHLRTMSLILSMRIRVLGHT